MKKTNLESKIVTAMLLVVIIAGSIWSKAYFYSDELVQAVIETIMNKEATSAQLEKQKEFLDMMPFKRMMIDLNGTMAQVLNLRELYKNSGGVVLENGYVSGIYGVTTTNYELQQIVDLKDFLDEKGIQLLYVNEPTKYFDDAVIERDMGKRTYINANADTLLERMAEAGVNYIDLREIYTELGYESFDLFYKTDHHWTVRAGKIAAEAIAAELNGKYGYNIDLTLYEDEKFLVTHYENAWLGEQGRKLGTSFVGLDDFDLILPDYYTDYTVTYMEGNTFSGAFGEVLVYQGAYSSELNSDVYEAPSWHYSYMATGLSGSVVYNNINSEGKKILVLGDSFDQVTVPFLSLGVSEVQTLVLRNYEGSLREYISEHDIDTVIIAYASIMIGAHDNEASANYDMFDFS